MRLLAAFSLLLVVACPQAPVEPPAEDAGELPFDGGSPVVDAGPEAPNPCGCPETQSCAVEFLDCEEPEVCEDDGDCIGERICVQGSCYDCWGGERAACTGNQRCSREGECHEPAVCRADEDCFEGLRCVEGLCEGPDPCDHDGLEPNNLPEFARRVAGVRKGLWACHQPDWYKIRVRAKAVTVKMRLTWEQEMDPPVPDMPPAVDMRFYSADGRPMAAEVNEREDGILHATVFGAPEGEDLMLLVTGPMGPVRYDLAIEQRNDFCPTVDTEPNQSIELATMIPYGQPVEGSLCALPGEAEDRDVYAVSLLPGQRVGFVVENRGGSVVEVAMVNAAGRVLGAPVAVATRQGRGLLPVLTAEQIGASGVAWVRLRGVGAVYSITFALFQIPANCEDDGDEPDDQPAFSVALDGVREGVLCPGSPDYSEINLQARDGVKAEVVSVDGSAAGWRLTGPNGQNWPFQASPDGFVLNLEHAPMAGAYQIVGLPGAEVSAYRLRAEAVPGGLCLPDGRDPGDDTVDGANRLAENSSTAFQNACADDDWFLIPSELGRQGRLRIRRFSNQERNIFMDLFVPDDPNPVASGVSRGSYGDLEFVGAADGDHHLRIRGAADQTLRYQLQLLGPPPANDLCANPQAIRNLVPGEEQVFTGTTAGAHDNTQSRCGGVQAGDVQYLVRVPEGGGVLRFALEPSPGANLMLSLATHCGGEELYCDNDGGAGINDLLEADLDGGIYALSVDTRSSFAVGGDFTLRVNMTGPETRAPFVHGADGCTGTLPVIPMPENELGLSIIRSSFEGLGDASSGSCGFNLAGADGFFRLSLQQARRVRLEVPSSGRMAIYVRLADCRLPVDMACQMTWSGGAILNVGVLPAGDYTVVVDSLEDRGDPFRLFTTLSEP